MLNILASNYGLPVIVSVHPRTRKRIDSTGVVFASNVRLMRPLGFPDFVHLMMNARATLSDSGTITEEASILNLRALNLREAHERPEGMEEGSVMMTGLNPQRVIEALEFLKAHPAGSEGGMRTVGDYAVPNVSEKVSRIILSYTDYVNRTVWRKE